jgi:hypothetical protein
MIPESQGQASGGIAIVYFTPSGVFAMRASAIY